MSRILRLDFPETLYHIYQRGIRKSPIFHDDEDRWTFLKSLERAKKRKPFDLLNYSLMTNHFHFELKTVDDRLSETMHYLNLLYASYYNYRYEQAGHVYEGRYHSIVVEQSHYLLRLSRYIDLNACEAGMVKHPEDYPWCGYRAIVGKVQDPLLSPELILDTLNPDPATQRETYRGFVEEHQLKKPDFTERQLLKLRVLGNADFHGRTFAKARGMGLIPTQEKRTGI